jgi:coronin-1B/1C/6
MSHLETRQSGILKRAIFPIFTKFYFFLVWKINQFLMPDTHRTIGMMPKRGEDVTKNEITHFYRITNSNKCEVISAIVPRTSKGFLEDLYPNTLGLVPALSAEAWFIGEDGMPILVLDET